MSSTLEQYHHFKVIAAAGAVLLSIYYFRKQEAIGCPIVDPAIPRLEGHKPIIGNLLFPMDQLTDKFVAYLNKHPETKAHLATYPFWKPVLWITDPVIIEHITIKKFDNYIKGEHLNEKIEDVLGHGILKFI